MEHIAVDAGRLLSITMVFVYIILRGNAGVVNKQWRHAHIVVNLSAVNIFVKNISLPVPHMEERSQSQNVKLVVKI